MEKGDLEVRTSYLTAMDIWFVAMKTFSVISLIESLVVLALIKRSRAVVCMVVLVHYGGAAKLWRLHTTIV